MENLLANLAAQGITGLLFALALWYYVKVERPYQRELERKREEEAQSRQLLCDQQHSERIKDMIVLMREQQREAAEREVILRREHADSWEIHREQARKDREDDRAMFREMIGTLTGVLKELKGGQDRNFALTLALGESVGQSKTHLITRTESITQKPVDEALKAPQTQHPDR